jgi:predicted small secreted protein
MSFHMLNGGGIMARKFLAVVFIGGALTIAACNTVRGAAADVNSAAGCTENAMHGGRC